MAARQVFEGLKVVDFGWVGVAPIAAKYLADKGASVVRIESATRPDILRTAAPYKDATPGLNRSQFWAAYNSSKMSLGLNMALPQAQAIAKRLVIEWADVVIEGMTPKAMRAWGLHYEALAAEKPSIIMLSTCQQGQSGPHAMFAGYGNTGASLGGYYAITGWPDREPAYPYGAYTDFVSPRFAAAAMIASLDYRDRTGKGQYIDQSQYEAGVQFLAPAVMDYALTGRTFERRGNADDRAAPHGVYRCQGTERWVAITVFSNEEWEALVKVMDNPAWAKDPRFATFISRKQNEAELNQMVEQWTANYSPEEVMFMCQAAGVAAGVVQTSSNLHDDPQLKHRGFFVMANHTECGPMPYDGFQFILSKTPGELRAAPCVGEHNEHILKNILKLSDDEVAELRVARVLETV